MLDAGLVVVMMTTVHRLPRPESILLLTLKDGALVTFSDESIKKALEEVAKSSEEFAEGLDWSSPKIGTFRKGPSVVHLHQREFSWC